MAGSKTFAKKMRTVLRMLVLGLVVVSSQGCYYTWAALNNYDRGASLTKVPELDSALSESPSRSVSG